MTEKEEEYDLPVVLTIEEAARFCRVNQKTYYAAVKAGKAPGKRIGGRLVVLRETLLDWLRSSECVLTSRRGAKR
jgi:excisionase family DNA binding protein